MSAVLDAEWLVILANGNASLEQTRPVGATNTTDHEARQP